MPRRWHQVGGSISVDDSGNKARSLGRARRKPLKPLRGECAGLVRCDRGDYARMLFLFCMRGCGCIERPAFPAPSDLQMAPQGKTRVRMRGEIAKAWLQRPSHSTQDSIENAISIGLRRPNENVGWPM